MIKRSLKLPAGNQVGLRPFVTIIRYQPQLKHNISTLSIFLQMSACIANCHSHSQILDFRYIKIVKENNSLRLASRYLESRFQIYKPH